MVKKTIMNLSKELTSENGVTIGELEPISTSQIKDTDLLATETDLSTNSISISQIKEVVSNDLLSYTNSKLGSIIFHPAPAGYQNIPAETNGFGDAILVADGRLLDKVNYPDLWNFIKTRRDKGIYGFAGETDKSFKIDELTDIITLPNLLVGDALYMGNFGLQNAIFPQHTFTSGNITPTTKPHSHTVTKTTKNVPNNGIALAPNGAEGLYGTTTSSNSTVELNPFTVSSSSITNLPAGVTVGTDYKIAGVKMIPCIVCKPTYEINAGGGGSGGGVATEDLNMNLFKIINLGVPVGDSDAVRLVDLKLDNNKILYKKNGASAYDSLQSSMDSLWLSSENYVNKHTGLMGDDYTIANITQPKNIITYEFMEVFAGISGYLKKDRSVTLTGEGTFNTKQIAGMDDLKDKNIIVTDSARVITTLKDKLIEMDAVIQSQANLITQLQEKTDTVRVFPRRFLKTTGLPTNLTIGGNQAKRILDEVTIQNVIGYDSTTFTLTGATNKIIKELITPPFTTKLLNIRISLYHTASMGNTQIQPTLWRVRNDEIATPTIVAGGTVIYNDDNDARVVTTMINSIVVNGDSDPFVKYGYYIELKNLTGTALTYSTIDILITATCDRGLTE